MLKKSFKAKMRANRVRAKIKGTAKRPRVSVYASLTSMFVQIIDDEAGATIVSGRDSAYKGTKTEKAVALGKDLAGMAKQKKINHVVFDRGSRKYHGRVKALEDAMRGGGLIHSTMI